MNDHAYPDKGNVRKKGFRLVADPTDLNTVKPELGSVDVYPDKVVLEWINGRWSGVAVYGSYDGISFSEIGRVDKNFFEDLRKNIKANTREWRFYHLQYLKDDKIIGLASEVVKVVAEIY